MLYKRIVEHGTLTEPGGVPDPQFALPSTINWMRGLAIAVQHHNLSFANCSSFYQGLPRRQFSDLEENSVFEQLFFSLHQLSALGAFRGVTRRSDVARMGIVTWYYGIYYAASAMIAAQIKAVQEDHAGTANTWDRNIVTAGFVMPPFAFRVSTLVEKIQKSEIQLLRAGNNFDLKVSATTYQDALGACLAYLSGTSNWYRWRITEDVRGGKEFKALNVNDFRTRKAQILRDGRLSKRSVSFLHEAFRYRGKANYREALFLGYGPNTETLLATYIDDLFLVLSGFVSMAGAFCSRRLDQKAWTDFVSDVESQRSFSLSPLGIWN